LCIGIPDDNVGENSAPDPSQAGAQSDHGTGDAAKPMGGWLREIGGRIRTTGTSADRGFRAARGAGFDRKL